MAIYGPQFGSQSEKDIVKHDDNVCAIRWHIPVFVPVCWDAGIQDRIPVPAGIRWNPAATSLMFCLFYGLELYFRSGPESVPV